MGLWGQQCHSNGLRSCGGCEDLLSVRSAILVTPTPRLHTHMHTHTHTCTIFQMHILRAFGLFYKTCMNTCACWCTHTNMKIHTLIWSNMAGARAAGGQEDGPPSLSALYWFFRCLSERQWDRGLIWLALTILCVRLTQMKAAVEPEGTSPHVKRCVFVGDTTGSVCVCVCVCEYVCQLGLLPWPYRP